MDWIGKRYSTGFCLTFARALSARTLLERLGVNPYSAALRTEEEAAHVPISEAHGTGAVVRAGRTKGWAFALETESLRGLDPQVLGRVSKGTQSVSLTRVIKPMTVFTFAENGEEVTSFDVTMPQLRSGRDPDRLVTAMAEVGLDPEGRTPVADPVRAMFALAERAFGLDLPEVTPSTMLLTGRLVEQQSTHPRPTGPERARVARRPRLEGSGPMRITARLEEPGGDDAVDR